MVWTTVYLIIAILIGIVGIWCLARQRNVFLSLTGVVWFLLVLFQFYIPKVYDFRIASGVPAIGTLAFFILIPVLVLLALLTRSRR